MPDPHALSNDEIGDAKTQLENQKLSANALDPDMKIKQNYQRKTQ